MGSQIHDLQFEFRREHSTVDAVMSMRAHAVSVVEEGGVLMAVSLDIENILPWEII